MNSIFFVFGFCSSILAATALSYFHPQPQTVIFIAPILFDYNWGDDLNMRVKFYNLSPDVIYKLYKADHTTSKVIKILKNDADVYSIHEKMMNTRIHIYIELETKAGCCENITIIEGRAVDRFYHPDRALINPCLGASPTCTIEMDLKNACTGPPSSTATVKTVVAEKSNNKVKVKVKVKSFISNRPLYGTFERQNLQNNKIDSRRPFQKVVFVWRRMGKKLHRNNTYMSNASPSSHENTDTTTIKSTTSDTNIKTTNITVMIIGSLSGITLILLAIIALYKRCWMKHSPQGTPDLPTNHHTEPFYLNMLFRRECEQEIAEIEQHQYEEINPQGSERVPEGS